MTMLSELVDTLYLLLKYGDCHVWTTKDGHLRMKCKDGLYVTVEIGHKTSASRVGSRNARKGKVKTERKTR